jgi:3'(2'), 5'-bisphosphate nucleotidase
VTSLQQEIDAAIELAVAAGRVVLERRGKAAVTHKAGGEPVTEADLAANRIIVDGLHARFPSDAILSEELVSDPIRLKSKRVWIIDPIDGTREYIDGTDDFAVQIGLAVDGVPVIGVVNQVAKHRLFAGVAGQGAWLDDPRTTARRTRRLTVTKVTDPTQMRLTVSRWHRSKKHTAIQDVIRPGGVIPAGSIGVKMGLVANAEADLYLHPSTRCAEWDTCGPDLILREAGGSVTDFFGKPLLYNQPDPHHPLGVAASNGAAHTQILQLLEPTVRGFGFVPR